MTYPIQRMRRTRENPVLRAMVRENSLAVHDLIYPLFIVQDKDKKIPLQSMPDIFQYSPDRLPEIIKPLADLNIPAVLLFGIPAYKDAQASSAYDPNGPVQEGIKRIKDLYPDLLVITDVCLCEYMDHGHCGIVQPNGRINNDDSLRLLAWEALSHAEAGADMVAPSDMMDGRVSYLRRRLDEEGYQNLPIMSYAAKFASGFYGPFREAAQSAPQFGDRRSYQMDPANFREAIREVELDIEEGADIVMVKPALAYLDVLKEVKQRFAYPTAAYNVSGEYAMIKAAAEKGWIDGQSVMMESLLSIKRAGADMIITYFALEAAEILNNSR